MKNKTMKIMGRSFVAALVFTALAAAAQDKPSESSGEPYKSMNAAHESFLKGDMHKAGDQIDKAAKYVKNQSDKVGEDSKAGMKKAGDDLDALGKGIKDGSIKSEDAMKKTYAKVDASMASCWHKTAADSNKAGKDSMSALKKSGAALEDASKWSGHQLSEGTKASVDAVKKAGKATADGAKTGADKVDGWFKSIGDGISDLGKKL